MNDFVIQGITILGTETVSYATWGTIIGFICGCFVVLAGVLGFFGCLKYGDSSLIPLVLIALVIGIMAVKICWEEWHKSPETLYTISIDDTARYNEIKNNFYYIRKLPNGLYEVKLNTQENN